MRPPFGNELPALSRLLESPERPFVAEIGGAKVSDKLKVWRSLGEDRQPLNRGGMANTSFSRRCTEWALPWPNPYGRAAKSIMSKAHALGKDVLSATDVVLAQSPSPGIAVKV
jgi:phosphoglycerate kinase